MKTYYHLVFSIEISLAEKVGVSSGSQSDNGLSLGG